MFVWCSSRKRKVVSNIEICPKIVCHRGEVVDQVVVVRRSGVQMKLEIARKLVKGSTGNRRKIIKSSTEIKRTCVESWSGIDRTAIEICWETPYCNSLSKVQKVQICRYVFKASLEDITISNHRLRWAVDGKRFTAPLLVNVQIEKEKPTLKTNRRVQAENGTNCSIEHVVFRDDRRNSTSKSSIQKPFHPVPGCFHTHTHTHPARRAGCSRKLFNQNCSTIRVCLFRSFESFIKECQKMFAHLKVQRLVPVKSRDGVAKAIGWDLNWRVFPQVNSYCAEVGAQTVANCSLPL